MKYRDFIYHLKELFMKRSLFIIIGLFFTSLTSLYAMEEESLLDLIVPGKERQVRTYLRAKVEKYDQQVAKIEEHLWKPGEMLLPEEVSSLMRQRFSLKDRRNAYRRVALFSLDRNILAEASMLIEYDEREEGPFPVHFPLSRDRSVFRLFSLRAASHPEWRESMRKELRAISLLFQLKRDDTVHALDDAVQDVTHGLVRVIDSLSLITYDPKRPLSMLQRDLERIVNRCFEEGIEYEKAYTSRDVILRCIEQAFSTFEGDIGNSSKFYPPDSFVKFFSCKDNILKVLSFSISCANRFYERHLQDISLRKFGYNDLIAGFVENYATQGGCIQGRVNRILRAGKEILELLVLNDNETWWDRILERE